MPKTKLRLYTLPNFRPCGPKSMTKRWRSRAVEIRDLTGRLDRASRQRDVMRDDNDHLLREMALAGSEIHQLQSRIHDLERDLENSQTARAAADVSLDRLRDELRLIQEEVVTNDYVGSAHDGSALGSARGGSPRQIHLPRRRM
ncbi:hypothetical protein GN958_ATG17436 [Phytophthora infestans]|uniref:Uncharacterized protein n=1 Tax=Phytophthora infestans TaxID=4787 RepID=A0A8S9TZA4_PHYIN|nr:hypothetical protein GN958_ATG17436 [Phytophthora infestans]